MPFNPSVLVATALWLAFPPVLASWHHRDANCMFGAAKAAPDGTAALLPLWEALPDRDGWQMLVSPAFPATWPPPMGGQREVVRYAFALRVAAGVADGAEMAAPWAKLTIRRDGGAVVHRLSDRLQPLGIQGVRPLATAEIALVPREQEVADRLLSGRGLGDEVVQAFTCNWIARQGVVASRYHAFAPRLHALAGLPLIHPSTPIRLTDGASVASEPACSPIAVLRGRIAWPRSH